MTLSGCSGIPPSKASGIAVSSLVAHRKVCGPGETNTGQVHHRALPVASQPQTLQLELGCVRNTLQARWQPGAEGFRSRKASFSYLVDETQQLLYFLESVSSPTELDQ